MQRVFRVAVIVALLAGIAPGTLARATPLTKTPLQVSAENTVDTGATFGYRLTYACTKTDGLCAGAQIIDLLPAQVAFISSVPASPTGDVAAINVTPNYMGSGRTRVQFVMLNPLPAGNSGDIIINVRFPKGTTPNGTVAVNTADALNLETVAGTFTTDDATVTAVAAPSIDATTTLTHAPAFLDLPADYTMKIAIPDEPGVLSLSTVNSVTATLPNGAVFQGAVPAANCQPGCVGTTPATVTWTTPCSGQINPGQACDIDLTLVYPSGTVPSGSSVAFNYSVNATPVGESAQDFSAAELSHQVVTFVPAPSASLTKDIAGDSPNPPTLGQQFSYEISPDNNGNTTLDTVVITDTLPVEFYPISVTTGAYSGATDYASGVGVRVSYEKNTAPGTFALWDTSDAVDTNETFSYPPPGLGVGEYVTRIRWEFGSFSPSFHAITKPRVHGTIEAPDKESNTVSIGDTITNCVELNATYSAGPTPVTRSNCKNFNVSGPFVQFNPAKVNLSGGGPFNPGQTVTFRLQVRSDARSSDPVPLADVVVSDLLPVDLTFYSWAFDDRGSGLPAPQVFEQIPNFAGTGRTLLRWRWNSGSGNLGVGQDLYVDISTTVRQGAVYGALSNDFAVEHDAPGLGQRCTTTSVADSRDLDGDGDVLEALCVGSGSVSIAAVSHVVAGSLVASVCGKAVGTVSTTVYAGCAVQTDLRLQNFGTVPLEDLVVVDILPFVGDTSVRQTNPRGSQWNMTLSAPIVAPPGTSVYYSTSGNPCRGEVGGPTTGCDPANWTTVLPTPISAVRAFKVVFNDVVLQPFDVTVISLHTQVQLGITSRRSAFNSFAYQAERADGLGILAAEPSPSIYTGVISDEGAISGRVWNDTNEDGQFDDGTEAGRNDVVVRLYALPERALLTSVLTSSEPGGGDGRYIFNELEPGSYQVCVERPLTTLFSAIGGLPAGSSANASVACSSATISGTLEQIDGIDYGVFPSETGAISGYAWIDRNGDGLQNDAVNDGLNGIAVRVYADDGDNTPDGDDLLVAATLTTDAAPGTPGYYQIDGLDPIGSYYVRFALPEVLEGFTTQDAGDDTLDSDVDPNGYSGLISVNAGQVSDVDAGYTKEVGTLSLGNQIWLESDNDGIYEPENGEPGIDGVVLELYRDANNNLRPDADERVASTTTALSSGNAGRYLFSGLVAGSYIVVFPAGNFVGGGPLYGYTSANGNDPAPDPDDDADGDDNGFVSVVYVRSLPITLTAGGEPTTEDGDSSTNLTLDFGFVSTSDVEPQYFDYGDAIDIAAGTGSLDYNTTAFDDGPAHKLGEPDSPILGECVDADNGFAQNQSATADDVAGSTFADGTCDAGSDEDGVQLPEYFLVDELQQLTVTVSGASACYLNAWIDWNQNGQFGDVPDERIAFDVILSAGANPVDVLTPHDALGGTTFARFRCSSFYGLGPTGPIGDGEVEDYAVRVVDDITPPVTTASATANSATYTFGDWTKFSVVISLSVDDGDGMGVAATYYAINAADCNDPSDASCLTYTGPFTLSADGVYTVTFFSVDLAGNVGSLQSETVRKDSVAPKLKLPGNIVQPLGGANGAVVTFTVTATDALDTSPTIQCTPQSGSNFPLGVTTVNCTATDDAGNLAGGSFTVTVKSPQLMFDALKAQINASSMNRTLKQVLLSFHRTAEVAYQKNRIANSCLALNQLEALVQINVKLWRIRPTDANLIYARITDIRSVLGCTTSRR